MRLRLKKQLNLNIIQITALRCMRLIVYFYKNKETTDERNSGVALE